MSYFIAPNFLPPPANYNLVSNVEKQAGKQVTVNPEVELALRSLMSSIPSLNFTRRNFIISQTGPIKPDRLTPPKPSPIVPSPPTLPNPSQPATQPIPVSVIADRQEFNAKEQIFIATGNVTVKYLNSELKADVVKLNLVTQDTTATGNVLLTRGTQLLRATNLAYNYGTSQGTLNNASGFVNLGDLSASQVKPLPSDLKSKSTIINVIGAGDPTSQDVGRFGFKAEKLIIDGELWTGTNLKITNDPFSPPELELSASKVTLTKISPTQDRLEAESPALIFDQGFTLPIPFNNLTLDRFQRSFPVRLGFDRRETGGFFYQQNFDTLNEPGVRVQISPQLFLQKALEGNILDANILGVVAKLDANLPDSQFFSGGATISGLNLGNLENQLRANLQYNRTIFGDHQFVARYAYRERVFNGSLSFQDIRNNLGVSLISPNYVLGDTGINFSYQLGAQYIGADRNLGNSQPTDVASLLKVQGATALSRLFPLWRATPLPAEKESGLKYQPEPVMPGIDAVLGVAANYAAYSSGDTQSFLSYTIGLVGTFGNFSQPFLDYTKINVSYTQGLIGGRSPFLFDRIADAQTINLGIVQQIYGPFRIGAQQSWNPATGRIIDSNYSLQYDRRTYAIVIQYNPIREIGEIVLRISDFNWVNSGDNVTEVSDGIERR